MRVAENNRQRIVQFVSRAGDHSPESRHALRLDQLLGAPALTRDVHQRFYAALCTLPDDHRRKLELIGGFLNIDSQRKRSALPQLAPIARRRATEYDRVTRAAGCTEPVSEDIVGEDQIVLPVDNVNRLGERVERDLELMMAKLRFLHNDPQ